MSNVKPARRPYRSRLRAEQATGTRDSVLAAAEALFLHKGWIATTIAAIATKAGVSKETIYSTFGTKTAILHQLIERAVRGANPGTPLIEQEEIQRLRGVTDQARQIDIFARGIAEVLARVAPLMDVARVAAQTDEAMAEFFQTLQRGRRRNLVWFAEALVINGPLRSGMTADTAGTILWRLASPDLFLLMRRVEGVSQQDYVEWLATSLKLLLLR